MRRALVQAGDGAEYVRPYSHDYAIMLWISTKSQVPPFFASTRPIAEVDPGQYFTY